MTDISPPTGLKPQSKFFEDVGEHMVNIDGVIRLLMDIDTPKAKALRRVFRRKFAEWRSRSDLTEAKQKEGALLATFDALGIITTDMGVLTK